MTAVKYRNLIIFTTSDIIINLAIEHKKDSLWYLYKYITSDCFMKRSQPEIVSTVKC